ncbi:hypothetical protein Vadar_008827 [Vaccinium darrowii]|uniref:Uncharacterized protein n=1 Tax=Vaccinium darrowii TaxID=229202 RepID=A0ACB7YUF8_9ERIC|nr:hypothetical protein Vadar_008827 [Vaccinium darrowii]
MGISHRTDSSANTMAITNRNPMIQRLYYQSFSPPILHLNCSKQPPWFSHGSAHSTFVGPIDTDSDAAASEWTTAAVGNPHPTCCKFAALPQLLLL